MFAQYGLSDNVKLLDGGRRKWEAEKRPLDTRAAEIAASRFTVSQRVDGLRARLPDVLAAARGERGDKILDIRSPDEFSGKVIAPPGSPKLAIRAGHIPGSVNVPWGRAVNADGTIIGMVAYLRVAPLGVASEIDARSQEMAGAFGLLPSRLKGRDGFRGCATVVRDALLTPNGVFVAG